MDTIEDINLIDRYIKHQLSEEEVLAFNERLSIDKDFSNAYDFVITVSKASKNIEAERIKLFIQSDGKVIKLWKYVKIVSLAAASVLIFLIWQPQHTSDKNLFANYSSNLDDSSITDFTKSDLIKEQSALRGEEEHFRNYTYNETLQLLEAIALVQQKDFEKAKDVFITLHVEKEKNPGLALYLSIAQLNTDKLDDAIKNLEYLIKFPGFSYQDETKYHLAFAYLKSGERKKAKQLLNDLVRSKSKFSDQAQKTLNKIRWF